MTKLRQLVKPRLQENGHQSKDSTFLLKTKIKRKKCKKNQNKVSVE